MSDYRTVVVDALLRLGLAVFAGGAIGLNRDLRGKPTGVRTHSLVALAACAILLVCEGGGADARSRVIQGVLTGVGFLCAGVIVRNTEGAVTGLTTSATIWMTAVLGVICAEAKWPLLGVATGLALLVLVLGGRFEKLVQRLVKRS